MNAKTKMIHTLFSQLHDETFECFHIVDLKNSYGENYGGDFNNEIQIEFSKCKKTMARIEKLLK